ncbi:hypothetical protein H0I23_07190 [Cellulophaga sp. HaHaR_3_176]|uniref:hypothetical protein n=1 Tax=Cellulophaga sp. HaHaR_3_176 TaxID=1942464 RepID=UPI001C1F9B66|nr:hypothetical protein [Cellulophaga sp. HaHaR_3_176]QWX85417.1 hypothetical protein H0I23_07190 [Cellulophaga sp. HaHaR_3_176]
MKNRLQILFLILTLISYNAFACTCSIPKSLKAIQDYEFQNSDCIFIGEVLKIDFENSTFEIKVVESFNGDGIGNIYEGTYDNYCGPIINKEGRWLIYGNYNTENLIEINACGLTRSFENPENNVSATTPPEPLPPNKKESKTQAENERTEWKLRAKYDLENEVTDLRKRTE